MVGRVPSSLRRIETQLQKALGTHRLQRLRPRIAALALLLRGGLAAGDVGVVRGILLRHDDGGLSGLN